MAIAFTFPGQGSQKVGMGKELADAFSTARDVYAEIDDALGVALSKIMWDGPAETLTLTENAQPALMAVSLAAMRVLETEHGFKLADKVEMVAGHSLGEYSALAAAGALSLPDTARLLQLRGRSMQEAVPLGQGGMAALLGLDFGDAVKVADKAAEGDVCQAANDNAPGQVVVSGSLAAVERAVLIAKDFGARRAVMLDVSAPFHCALMQPAADKMAAALDEIEVKAPVVPLIANVLAGPVLTPADIKKRLVEQVTGTVRWRESVSYMAANGIDTVYEVGAGKVLTSIARRIERGLKAHTIGTPDDIDAALANL